MTAFQSLLSSVQATEDNRFSVTIEDTWLQGRTAFGGLSTALVVQAMQQQVPAERTLRVLNVAFVGPSPAGEHRIETRILREGGSVTHIQGDLICGDGVATAVTAAFGKPRASAITVPGPPMPETRPPDDCKPMPYIEGVTPTFTRHYDMRFTHGAPPLKGADKADFGMWLKFREPQPLEAAQLIAIADVPPMPGLNMIKPPGVGSSLTWSLDFPAQMPNMGEDCWFYFDYRCDAAGDGYYNVNATIWTEDGTPVMFSRQMATVFEKSG